jgi:nicotinamide mononucleotide transporter
VGIIMPALDIYLYYSHGLYGDAGMAGYYTVAAIYGYAMWKFGKKKGQGENQEMPITHVRPVLYLNMLATFLVLWAVTYYVLDRWTNSTVPLLDAFTNALSFVGLWALAHKYVEQWICWIVVDAICTYLYIVKGIPFKAFLYGLYVVIAILGYRKWNSMAQSSPMNETATT